MRAARGANPKTNPTSIQDQFFPGRSPTLCYNYSIPLLYDFVSVKAHLRNKLFALRDEKLRFST